MHRPDDPGYTDSSNLCNELFCRDLFVLDFDTLDHLIAFAGWGAIRVFDCGMCARFLNLGQGLPLTLHVFVAMYT